MKLDGAHKSDVRTQFAALCYRIHNGKVEFCLITSRNAGRWIIPKGWPMDGTTPAKAAATEAFEEAGLEGKVHAQSLGVFTYEKEITDGTTPCLAIVYALRVKTVLSDWPERPIYGEARAEDARKLLEDGIPVLPLPFMPKRNTN